MILRVVLPPWGLIQHILVFVLKKCFRCIVLCVGKLSLQISASVRQHAEFISVLTRATLTKSVMQFLHVHTSHQNTLEISNALYSHK